MVCRGRSGLRVFVGIAQAGGGAAGGGTCASFGLLLSPARFATLTKRAIRRWCASLGDCASVPSLGTPHRWSRPTKCEACHTPTEGKWRLFLISHAPAVYPYYTRDPSYEQSGVSHPRVAGWVRLTAESSDQRCCLGEGVCFLTSTAAVRYKGLPFTGLQLSPFFLYSLQMVP